MWTVRRSRAARPTAEPRPGRITLRRQNSLYSADCSVAPRRTETTSPSNRAMSAPSAPASRAAFSTRVSSTGWRSNVERLITLSTSLVAVCCSSATRSSLFRASSSVNRRTFSMAMTAWSANVSSSAICGRVKGRGSVRANADRCRSAAPRAATGTPAGSGTGRRRRFLDPRTPESTSDVRRTCTMARVANRAPAHRPAPAGCIGKCSPQGSDTCRVEQWTATSSTHSPSKHAPCRPATAQPDRALRDGVEDRLHVGRRARDHAQDLAGRGLLLQGLGEVGVPGLQLAEQPRVLDRDHGLVGERLEQRDLGGREAADLVPVDPDHPDDRISPQHRHRDDRAEAAQLARRREASSPRTGRCPRRRRAGRRGSGPPGPGDSPPSEERRPELLQEGLAAPGQAAPRRHQANQPALRVERPRPTRRRAAAWRSRRWPRRPAGRRRARPRSPSGSRRWRPAAPAPRSACARAGRSSPAPRRARPAGPRPARRAQHCRVTPSLDPEGGQIGAGTL